MEPDFKPDSTEETIFSENVVDALCSLVILPLLVGGIVYLSWDSTREVKSEKTSSRIVPGASMAELVLPDGTKVMLDREMNRALEEGVRNSGDTLNYTEVVSGGLQDSCEIYHTLLCSSRGRIYFGVS